MFHVPEEGRFNQIGHSLHSSKSDGNNGAFFIKSGSDILQCVASDGHNWEHVSITIRTKNRQVCSTPSWEIMCLVKDIFWDDEDCVVQYHPPKSEYVNNHPYVLHLWRLTNAELPRPHSIMVGIK